MLHCAVLSARNTIVVRDGPETKPKIRPKVVVIGDSFGARAAIASLTLQPNLMKLPVKLKDNFESGDMFVALQGAFKIEELFADKKIEKGPWPAFKASGLRGVLTTSSRDAAN